MLTTEKKQEIFERSCSFYLVDEGFSQLYYDRHTKEEVDEFLADIKSVQGVKDAVKKMLDTIFSGDLE